MTVDATVWKDMAEIAGVGAIGIRTAQSATERGRGGRLDTPWGEPYKR